MDRPWSGWYGLYGLVRPGRSLTHLFHSFTPSHLFFNSLGHLLSYTDQLISTSPAYSALIQHILRSEKLPTLEEVCSQVQKEEGSIGLFGTKETLSFASQAERSSQPNKAPYKKGDRRGLKCEHCKRDGHTKERCWILNPSLKPAKFK